MNTDGHLTAREAETLVQPTPSSRGLTPAERLAVSDHLARCAACRALVAAARVGPGNGPRILQAEMQRLTHAAQTERLEDAADIQAFARRMQGFSLEHFEPGGTLPPARSARAEPTRAMVPWWTAWFSPGGYVFAGSALAALIAFLGITTFVHRGGNGPSPKVATAQPLLQDGPVLVAADGSLQASADIPTDLRAAILETIQRRAINLPSRALGAMRGETGSPASANHSPVTPPSPLMPAPGSTVEAPRPVLSWSPVAGATGYQVEIRSVSTGDKILSLALLASDTHWQPERPLERGRLYRWSVNARLPPGSEAVPPASASLKILNSTDEETLRRLRTAPTVSHLALAVACARLDLAAEASQELEALSAKNPKSALAAQLRASLR